MKDGVLFFWGWNMDGNVAEVDFYAERTEYIVMLIIMIGGDRCVGIKAVFELA